MQVPVFFSSVLINRFHCMTKHTYVGTIASAQRTYRQKGHTLILSKSFKIFSFIYKTKTLTGHIYVYVLPQ